MPERPLRILILGAHPDDPGFHAGGLATMYRRRGDHVKMISLTDGRAGHHRCGPEELARLRYVARNVNDQGTSRVASHFFAMLG